MPLNPKVLEDELIKQSENAAAGMDIGYSDFVLAMEKYANQIQYPPPAGVAPAAKILKSVLESIPSNPPLPIAVPILKAAVQLFALGIMMGAPIGTGLVFPTTPPAGQPAIDSILSQPNDVKVVAKQLSIAIHTYMITGTFDAFGVPPSGPGTPIPGYTPWT